MKKIILLAVAALISISAFAQNCKSIYTKYNEKPGVSAVFVSPSMFKLMGRVPSVEGADFSTVIQSLEAMYVLDCENYSIASQIKADVLKYVETKDMELMMEARDEEEIVKVYTISKGEFVTDFIMLAYEHNECVFIGIEGKLSPESLGQVISSMDM